MTKPWLLSIIAVSGLLLPTAAHAQPLETGFDLSFKGRFDNDPSLDTFTQSYWETGGGLAGFSKAKAGYAVHTSLLDVVIYYDWRIPNYPIKGELYPGSLAFFTYGQQSTIQWTTETCTLTPVIKTATAVWHLNTNLGFPTESGPAEYHEPQPSNTTCFPEPDHSVELKMQMRILHDDDTPAATLADLTSTVELTPAGDYQYTYIVKNLSSDLLDYHWDALGLAGVLNPMDMAMTTRVSPSAPRELLTNASLALVFNDMQPGGLMAANMVMALDDDPPPMPPSFAGNTMSGPAYIYVPVPEPSGVVMASIAIGLTIACRCSRTRRLNPSRGKIGST